MTYRIEYFVCFRRIDEFRWWQIFTGKKRQHIFVIFDCKNNNSAMIDVVEGGIALYTFDDTALNIAKKYLKEGCEVIKYISTGDGFNKPKIKLFRTCVSIAKDLLGINAWWIQLPDQLFEYLMSKQFEMI